jgi:hypothetical protein
MCIFHRTTKFEKPYVTLLKSANMVYKQLIVYFLKPLLADGTDTPHVYVKIFLPGYIPQVVMVDGLSTRM